jgi:hypothetical protein
MSADSLFSVIAKTGILIGLSVTVVTAISGFALARERAKRELKIQLLKKEMAMRSSKHGLQSSIDAVLSQHTDDTESESVPPPAPPESLQDKDEPVSQSR